MKKHTLFVLSIMGVALCVGLWRDHFSHPPVVAKPILSVTTLLSSPQKISPFALTDMHGKPFTPKALKNYWSFLFFGYSACPDICPSTLGALTQIAQHLQGIPAVQYIFISIDADTDTPQHLKNFLSQTPTHNVKLMGVTGKKMEVHRLAQTAGVAIESEDNTASKNVAHGGALLLVNPQGEIAAVITNTDKPHAIAHDFKEILHHAAS